MVFTWAKFRDRVVRKLRYDGQTNVDLNDVDALNEEISLGLAMYCADSLEVFVPHVAGTAQGNHLDLELVMDPPIVEPDQVWIGGRELQRMGYDTMREEVDMRQASSGEVVDSHATRFAWLQHGQIILDAYLPPGTTIEASGWSSHPPYESEDQVVMVGAPNIELATIYCARQFMGGAVLDEAGIARLARYDRVATDGVAVARSRNLSRYYAGMTRG